MLCLRGAACKKKTVAPERILCGIPIKHFTLAGPYQTVAIWNSSGRVLSIVTGKTKTKNKQHTKQPNLP